MPLPIATNRSVSGSATLSQALSKLVNRSYGFYFFWGTNPEKEKHVLVNPVSIFQEIKELMFSNFWNLQALEKYRYEQSLEHTSQFIEKLEKELEEYHEHVAKFKKGKEDTS